MAGRLAGVLLPLVTLAQTARAQGVLTPPPYERGRAGVFTLQAEQSLRLSDVNTYDGSWAFRVRHDRAKWAASGMAGVAYAAERAALFGLTANIKLFGESPSLRRWVGGITADAATASTSAAGRTTALSAGVALGHEHDTAGFGRSVMVGGRGGILLQEAPGEDEGFWGASVAATIGIPRRFQIFAQVDYASAGFAVSQSVWTLGTGLRVRVGPGA
ncbi:MAG: hypothetical protein WEE89_21665 [Gemmatimonadota bacterium]